MTYVIMKGILMPIYHLINSIFEFSNALSSQFLLNCKISLSKGNSNLCNIDQVNPLPSQLISIQINHSHWMMAHWTHNSQWKWCFAIWEISRIYIGEGESFPINSDEYKESKLLSITHLVVMSWVAYAKACKHKWWK